MRKKILSVMTALVLSFAMLFAFTACDVDDSDIDYGTLTVENVTVEEGGEAELSVTFSKPEREEAVTYEFESDAFTIEDGKVKAVAPTEAVTVTAKTEHISTTFTVTVEAIDYGTLTVDNVTVTEKGEAELNVMFSKPERAETVDYEFESDAFTIEDGKVKAVAPTEAVTVTAKTAHISTTFTVTVEAIDYGTLTIRDIEGIKLSSNPVKITPVFSKPEYASEITYSFEGKDIVIENGYVKAVGEGKTVVVTATTDYHETTFIVTTLIDYGTLVIDDAYAWIGYPATPLDIEFEYENHKEQLTFKYDETKLEIDEENMTINALAEGEFIVEASSEHFKQQFVVTCERVNKKDACYNTSNYDSYVATLKNNYANRGNDGNTTLFIGDSFFDTRYFWTNFSDTYAGKDALCCGVSSTTTYDWEVFTESFLKFTNPKNIAMHIGTNNVYDDGNDVDKAVSALQRMFLVMHETLPETNIYWFNISQRSYDNDKITKVYSINAAMREWCAKRSWLTYVDTSSKLTNDMLKDSVHPKLEHYSVFVNALKDTDIEIMDAPVKTGVDFADITGVATKAEYDKTNSTVTLETAGRARYYLMNGNDYYNGNFVVSGVMSMRANGNNPWIEMLVSATVADGWFNASSALPVSVITFVESGSSELWGYLSSGRKESITTVTGGKFEFTVIVYNGALLFKINDTVRIYENAAFKDVYFAFGAENAKLDVTSLNVVIDDDNAVRAKYNELAPEPSASINDIVRDKRQSIMDNEKNIVYKNETLSRNFILSGKIDITDKANNGHIHFKFNGDTNRVLLWDNETKDRWKVGYACGAYNADAPENAIYTREEGKTLTIDFKIVITDSDAYFYFNGELRLVWKNLPGTSMIVSSEHVTCKIYDMKALSLRNDKEEYEAEIAKMQETIDAYKNAASGVTRA